MAKPDTTIRADHPWFPPFLDEMVETRNWTTEDVIRCVSQPWRWQEEFTEFLAIDGGSIRDGTQGGSVLTGREH